MWVNPSVKPSAAQHGAAHLAAALQVRASSRSRRAIVTGLIHSWIRVSSGRGRYRQTFSKRIFPFAQTVS